MAASAPTVPGGGAACSPLRRPGAAPRDRLRNGDLIMWLSRSGAMPGLGRAIGKTTAVAVVCGLALGALLTNLYVGGLHAALILLVFVLLIIILGRVVVAIARRYAE